MYDDDVQYLELLLDHAVAAQEEENEAKQQKRLNGELEPPVNFFFGGGVTGGIQWRTNIFEIRTSVRKCSTATLAVS